MGIDISTIINNSLRALAKDIDSQQGNNNNVLDGDEISIFNTESNRLIAQGDATVDEVNEIFGLEKSEEVKSFATNPMQAPELSKKDRKKYQKQIKQSVENYVAAGVKPEQLIQKLNKEYDARRNSVINEVQYVLNLVNATNYNSKDDVEKISDTVKEQLKNTDKNDNFHKDILKILVKQAKEVQIAKEADMLISEYREVKATMAGTDIVKQQGDNFKAYVEIVKDKLQKEDANGKKAWDSSYIQEAFEQLENYAKKDAKLVVGAQINETHKESDTRRKVNKEVKAQNKGGDAYQNEARHDMVGGVVSRKKNVEGKIAARRNKVELKKVDLKAIKAEDLEDELGKSFFQKFNFFRKNKAFDKLDKTYLSSMQNADGTYNLEPLVDEIITRVGKDYLVNRAQDDEMAELTHIKRHLQTITGQEFTDFEAKKILKLCDIQLEKKDRSFKTVANQALLGLPGLITAAIVPLRIDRSSYQSQTVDLIIHNQTQLDDITAQMREQGFEPEVTQLTKGKFAVKIHQEQLSNDKFKEILVSAGTAVLSLLTNALVAWALGEEKDEKSCMSISDYSIKETTYTNANEYKEYISTIYKNPEKVEAINGLVDAYVEAYGDEWHAHYQQALREAAGIGSKLNPEECRTLKYLLPQGKVEQQTVKQDKPVQTTPTKPVEQTPVEETPVQETPCKDENCAANIYENINMEDSHKYYWDEIIKMYYSNCLQENGGSHTMKEIRFKLRAVNNIPNNYTSVPKGIQLPYDLFGDGSCERTERQTVKLRPRGTTVKAKVLKMQKGGFIATSDCDENVTATGKTRQEALDNLKAKTGKTYTNEAELLQAS